MSKRRQQGKGKGKQRPKARGGRPRPKGKLTQRPKNHPGPPFGTPPGVEHGKWGEWIPAKITEANIKRLLAAGGNRPDEIWHNGLYQVMIQRNVPSDIEGWPAMHWLSIKRVDKDWIHDWRHLQRIKNELIGEEFEAVELYPAESRLVDTANQYHLWALTAPGRQFPFGYRQRLVGEAGVLKTSFGIAEQRPFEDGQEPEDIQSNEEYEKELQAAIDKAEKESVPSTVEDLI